VERRGGNHGCDDNAGTFYSSDFWPAGDRISIGYQFDESVGPPPGVDQHELFALNKDAESELTSGLRCGKDDGNWNELTSDLGPGDDSVRLDARGLPPDGGLPYEPVHKSIDALLLGGNGADMIRGHTGFDDVSGGPGADVVRVDDGRRDLVNCGPGQDRADVDRRDDVTGCEKET